jgi:hypothetical protein
MGEACGGFLPFLVGLEVAITVREEAPARQPYAERAHHEGMPSDAVHKHAEATVGEAIRWTRVRLGLDTVERGGLPGRVDGRQYRREAPRRGGRCPARLAQIGEAAVGEAMPMRALSGGWLRREAAACFASSPSSAMDWG